MCAGRLWPSGRATAGLYAPHKSLQRSTSTLTHRGGRCQRRVTGQRACSVAAGACRRVDGPITGGAGPDCPAMGAVFGGRREAGRVYLRRLGVCDFWRQYTKLRSENRCCVSQAKELENSRWTLHIPTKTNLTRIFEVLNFLTLDLQVALNLRSRSKNTQPRHNATQRRGRAS